MRDPDKKFFSRRKNEREKLDLWYQKTYIGLVGFIIFLLIYYVWTLNVNATQGYEIRKLQNMSRELKNDLNRLNSTISELDSSNTILSDDMVKEMQQSYDPQYLVIKEEKQYVYNY